MIRSPIFIAFFLFLIACSNSYELETGEIRTFKVIKESLEQANKQKQFVSAKKLISRDQIDAANIPVLFVELSSGQNGTLTPYPGKGVGQTWLGADGATVTLEKGILKASRGMGDDVMGGETLIPQWTNIKKTAEYKRKISFLDGNNQIVSRTFLCKIAKTDDGIIINIWNIDFEVVLYEEYCSGNSGKIKNEYYLDRYNIVRKSKQYHSETVGYITIERLDR